MGMVLQGCGVSMRVRAQRFAGRGSKDPRLLRDRPADGAASAIKEW